MKKIIAILLSAILAVSVLAACGQSSDNKGTTAGANDAATDSVKEETTEEQKPIETSEQSEKGEFFGDLITIACSSGQNSFDPFARGGGYGAQVAIFERLAQVSKQGDFMLLMLKSINEVDDVTYECELWDFIEDTAGNNITANDVKWSIENYIDQGNKGGVAKLDNIEVTGDYTFIWHNSAPFGAGEMSKQFGNPPIVSQASYESDPDMMASNPVGTGPYKLKDFMEGSYGLFEANEDYWYNKIDDAAWLAENNGVFTYQNYKEIRLDVISDASARAIALENGTVDACTTMNSTDVLSYANNPDITAINLPVDPPVGFYFNLTDNSVCSDVNLRKAICYGIDNAGIAAGLDVPAFEVFGINPRMIDAPEDWTSGREYYDFDQDKAKECLAQTSYNGEPIKVYYTDGDQRNDAWILIQAQLSEIGINVQLNLVEMSSYDTVKFDFTAWDILSETFGGGSYVPNTVKRWWSEEQINTLNGLNVCGVEDHELDRLYEEILNNYSEEAIDAWDQYFTYDNCIGYGVCCFDNLTACRSEFEPVTFGSQSQLVPGAFAPKN